MTSECPTSGAGAGFNRGGQSRAPALHACAHQSAAPSPQVRASIEAAQREEAARLREEAKAEALALIKPQLQRQQAVEVAIREAEERARDRERQLASQVRA